MKYLKTYLFFFFILISFSCTKEDDVSEEAPCYKDGKYSAVASIKDDWGGSAKVEIVVKNGKITSCVFSSYEENGKLKDAEYGKVGGVIKNMGLYKIAQNAMTQAGKYGQMLIESQDINKLDALSGATVSFGLFKDAVLQIVEEAQISKEKSSSCRT